MKNGHFRDDLYYRLQVVSINIPPLRDRGEDCLVLTEYFIRRFNERYDRVVRGWDTDVAEVFLTYGWPGNVRELENLLERIFVLETDDIIKTKHIPPRIMREVEVGQQPSPAQFNGQMLDVLGLPFQEATAACQKELIRQALLAAQDKKADAADALGLTRHALRHQMKKLGMR